MTCHKEMLPPCTPYWNLYYYQYNFCKVGLKVTSSSAGGVGKPGASAVEEQDIILGTESHGLGEWSKTPALGRIRRDGTWSVSGLPGVVCGDAGNFSFAWEPFHNEWEKHLRVQHTEMMIAIRYSSRHSGTSSKYMWHQWELIRYAY